MGGNLRIGGVPLTRAIIADARTTSGADFVRAFVPQKSRLTILCEQLWTACGDGGSKEERDRIHAEIAELSLVNVEHIAPGRIAA